MHIFYGLWFIVFVPNYLLWLLQLLWEYLNQHMRNNEFLCLYWPHCYWPIQFGSWMWNPSISRSNCYHQIIYCKLDFKTIYPPPYLRHVWDLKRSNINSIHRAIKMVDWHSIFMNKTVHEQLLLLTLYWRIFSQTISPINSIKSH